MGVATRYNEVGLAGRNPGNAATDQRDQGTSSDPFLRQFVIEIPRVASAAEQTLDFTMPANAIGVSGFLRVRTAEATGTTPTVDIGDSVGGATSLASALAAGAVANVPLETPNVNLSGAALTYTLGSADFAEFEGELVLLIQASDD